MTLARVALALVWLAPLDSAHAAYSAPLTRVRIDSSRVTHTPSTVYVQDEEGGALPFSLRGYGVQYVLQVERETGLGFQAGVFAGGAVVTTNVPEVGEFEADGTLFSGQLRLFYTLLASGAPPESRGHALTVFANVRAIQLRSTKPMVALARAGRSSDFQLSQLQVGGGFGAMAEVAIGSLFSFCPYAWFSPLLFRDRSVVSPWFDRIEDRASMILTRPLRVGADLWLYPYGASNESHVSLSAILSLVDTSGAGRREATVVLGYAFATP